MNTELTQKRIGLRIKHRRLELGLTQEELANRLGNKSRASVCTVENGKEDMTTNRIRQYAAALECSPSYLMGWDIEDDLQEIREAGMIAQEQYLRSRTPLDRLCDAYRAASPDTQAAVRAILHIEED